MIVSFYKSNLTNYFIFFEKPEIVEINSIESELNDFFGSIDSDSESEVPLRDGLLALEVAEEIMRQI